MGQLRALQEELSRLLLVGSQATRSPFWKEGLPERLQVYRNTVHGNCYDTLDADFPLTQKQFSSDDWFEVSEDFFTKHPPAVWELNACVQNFPAFLKKKKFKPYIAELAQYEYSDLAAYIHTATVKKGIGRANPTVLVQVFQHQIFDWAWDEADPAHPPKQKPEVVIFYRDTKNGGRIRRGDPLLLLLLDHYSQPGAQLEEAEPVRAKLLPTNKVPLQKVLDEMVKSDLILL